MFSVAVEMAASLERRLIDPLKSSSREHERIFLSIAMIIIGLGMALFGLRFLKVSLFVTGFLTGFVASFFSMNTWMDSDPALWGTCMAIGAIGGLVSYFFEKVGKVTIGGLSGVILAYVVYLAILHFIPDTSDATIYVSITLACLAGGFMGVKAHQKILIPMTAAVGCFSFVCGIDILTEQQLTYSHIKEQDLNALGWSLLAIWIVLTFATTYFQGCWKGKCSLTRKRQKGVLAKALVGEPTNEPVMSGIQVPVRKLFKTPVATPSHVMAISRDPCGLGNVGNTCFFNASIQTLHAVTLLRQFFLTNPAYSQLGVVSRMFGSLVSQLSRSMLPSIQPIEIRALLKHLQFDDGEQHDAFEFTRALLNALIDEVPTGSPNPVKDVFSFSTCGVVRCHECGNESVTVENCLDLSLEMPKTNNKNPVALEDMMSMYFKPTELKGENSYHCDKCNKRTEAVRILQMDSFPNSLVLSVNRFRFSPTHNTKVKLMTPITIPQIISISGVAYHLDGAVVHSGPSADGGHYYSFAKVFENPDSTSKKWYRFDDSHVSPSSFEKVRDLCYDHPNDSVYVLLYTK